jgi:hypothetical protein
MASQLLDYAVNHFITNKLGCGLDPETTVTKILSGFMNGNMTLVLRPGADLGIARDEIPNLTIDKNVSQLRSWKAYGARFIKQWVSRKIGEQLQSYVKAGTFSSRNVITVTRGRLTLRDIQFRSLELCGVTIDICVKEIKVKVEKGKITVALTGLTYGVSSGFIAAFCYGVAASAIVTILAPWIWARGSAELVRRVSLYGVGVT